MSLPAVAVTFDEMARLAEAVARSGLFGMKTPEQALALMAIAQAEGQHPALAARDYHIVSGRPVLKADAMLARFQAAGGKMTMKEYGDARVVAEFSHPQGGTIVVDWDIERAKRAGLGGKDNWRTYPRQMLRARVISEGVRTVFPGAVVGMLTPEEAVDLPPAAERDVTPASDKPATGVAALAARIGEIMDKGDQPVLTPIGEAVGLDEVLPVIDKAETEQALNDAVVLAEALPTEEMKTIARTRFRKRRDELRGAPA